jgi:BlaI family penicillinase repressor
MNDTTKSDVSLSELQLALMRVLWARGEASTADVVEALRAERPLAHTTVATLLTRLEKRGLLSTRRDGRTLLYSATVSEPEVQRSMVSGLLSNLFEGKASALLSHLLHESEIGDDDLAQMRALLKGKGRSAQHD